MSAHPGGSTKPLSIRAWKCTRRFQEPGYLPELKDKQINVIQPENESKTERCNPHNHGKVGDAETARHGETARKESPAQTCRGGICETWNQREKQMVRRCRLNTGILQTSYDMHSIRVYRFQDSARATSMSILDSYAYCLGYMNLCVRLWHFIPMFSFSVMTA